MVVLHPGDVVSTTDALPASLFGWQPTDQDARLGFFVELFELEYRVLDASGAEAITWTSANLTTSAVAGQTGLYAPGFTVPALSTSYGTWTIQWRFTVASGDDERTAVSYFRVIAATQEIADAHAQIQDMRDEGVPSTYTNARVVRALEAATRLFEEWTGRTFGPQVMVMDLDGRNGPILQLDTPVIGLTSASLTFTSFTTADRPISEGDLKVYNRHIRNKMLNPDDRQNPKLEWLRVEGWGHARRGSLGDADLISPNGGFAASQQNVRITGVFGYTDWDGSPFGTVPALVQEAVMRIAMRKLASLWVATGGGTSVGVSGPIASEKTMDQSVSYAQASGANAGAYSGGFTGDPEIDQIILTYMRPITIGGA